MVLALPVLSQSYDTVLEMGTVAADSKANFESLLQWYEDVVEVQ